MSSNYLVMIIKNSTEPVAIISTTRNDINYVGIVDSNYIDSITNMKMKAVLKTNPEVLNLVFSGIYPIYEKITTETVIAEVDMKVMRFIFTFDAQDIDEIGDMRRRLVKLEHIVDDMVSRTSR